MKTPPHPTRKWLRTLIWAGFWALTLVFILSIARWDSGRQPRAKVRSILESQMAASAKTTASEVAASPADPAEKAVPVNPASWTDKGADGIKDIEEIEEIEALVTLPVSGKDGKVDFLKLLRLLRLPVTEGMTQKQAAAAFLQYAGKFASRLSRLEADLAKGPWDWETTDAYMLANQLTVYSKLYGLLAQARLRTGARNAAESNLATMQLLATRGLEFRDLMGEFMAQGMGNEVAYTVRAGFESGGWTDAQLAEFAARGLGVENAVAASRLGVEAQQETLRLLARDKEKLRHQMELFSGGPGPFDQTLGRVGLMLTTDTQIDDQMALLRDTVGVLKNQFGADGRFSPLSPEDREDLAAAEGGAWGDRLLNPAHLTLRQPTSANYFDDMAGRAVADQTKRDFTQIGAALELYRRQHGNFPETLAEVAPLMPKGPPVSPLGGQPYSYTREGQGHRLAGPGLDSGVQSGTVIERVTPGPSGQE